MASKNIAKGFTCVVCKKFNEYNSYVYAHWSIDLAFTCECGSRFSILEGSSHLIKRRAPPKKKKVAV